MSLLRDLRGDPFLLKLLLALIAAVTLLVIIIRAVLNAPMCMQEGECHDEVTYVTHRISKGTSYTTPQHHRVCECLRYEGETPHTNERGAHR